MVLQLASDGDGARCPVRVKSSLDGPKRHFRSSPIKQTSTDRPGMSASCQRQTSRADQAAPEWTVLWDSWEYSHLAGAVLSLMPCVFTFDLDTSMISCPGLCRAHFANDCCQPRWVHSEEVH